MQNDSSVRTIVVAGVLSLVCSILVSVAAIKLRPLQNLNKEIDIKKKLLMAASLLKDSSISNEEVQKLYKKVSEKIIDLESGTILDEDASSFDLSKAINDKNLVKYLSPSEDIAKIKKISKKAKIYFTNTDEGSKVIILPIYGKGLWSTLYGFIVLDLDTTTVKGFSFYDHAETPGLGGEVDNPKWKATWIGKKIYNESFIPSIKVVKGIAEADNVHQIDGLSGATLTSRGVQNLVNFWASKTGYATFLKNIREGRITL